MLVASVHKPRYATSHAGRFDYVCTLEASVVAQQFNLPGKPTDSRFT